MRKGELAGRQMAIKGKGLKVRGRGWGKGGTADGEKAIRG